MSGCLASTYCSRGVIRPVFSSNNGVPPAYNPGVTYPLTVTVNDTGIYLTYGAFSVELTPAGVSVNRGALMVI